MALNIKPLSITAMLSGIKSFFQSQENNSKWKDLNTGAEGNFLMRLLANIVSVISSRVVTARREQHHDTANFMSSQIALAVDNGYPVFRGLNQRRTIQIESNVTRIIPALSVIGFYGTDHSIITLEQLALVEGETTKPFKVVIGALKEIQWQAKTSSLKKFVRHEQGISEDYILYLDGTPVETTKHAKDKIKDKYYLYTNHYKSVTVEYLNNMPSAAHRYSTDSVFTLRYVELDDVDSIEFSSEMFDVGTLVNTLTIEPFKPFEGIEDIKHNSPVYRETQNLIRSKADWRDMYKDTLPAFKEVTFRALTPSYTQVSYIKDDYTTLTKEEEEYIHNELEPARYFGRPFPDVEHSERETTTLDITLGLSDIFTDEDDVKVDVKNIINSMYKKQFKQKLNIYDVEEQLKQLPYVKYARVALHTEPREPFKAYRTGDLITEKITYTDTNNKSVEEVKTYRCSKILGRAGAVEPLWNRPTVVTTEIENTEYETVDNEVIWGCYKRLNSLDIPNWTADELYAVGDFVCSESCPGFMFKCIDIVSRTAASPPEVDSIEVGDFLEDGNLLLVCIPHDSNYQDRVSNAPYRMASSDKSRFNSDGKSFEVIGHIGNAAGTPTLQFTDALQELYVFPASSTFLPGNLWLSGDFHDYISNGDTLQVSMQYTKEVPYDEVSEASLRMSTIINAEVYEPEDEEEDSEDNTIVNNTTNTTTNTTVNITMNAVMSGYSGEAEPHVIDVVEGQIIEDFQLIVQCVTPNPTYAAWKSGTIYNFDECYNVYYKDSDGSQSAAPVPPDSETLFKSFQVVGFTANGSTPATSIDDSTHGQADTTTNTTTDSSSETIEPEEKNKNWKLLKRVKEEMEIVQKWIDSEPTDTMKVPEDVLSFYSSVGYDVIPLPDGMDASDRVTINILRQYYEEYNKYDEEQIFLFMKQFGVDRLTARNRLRDARQLGDPIANSKCLRYYDTVTGDLVYVDRFGTATNNEGKLEFEDNYDPIVNARIYAIRREDINIDKSRAADRAIKISRYVEDGSVESQIQNIEVPYVDTFLITVKSVSVGNYPINDQSTGQISKLLTCIEPAAPVKKYRENSYINLSYSITKDARILWEEVEDFENVSYAWNRYPNIEVNINVKY